MYPRRTLVVSGNQHLILVEKPSAYSQRYDFIGAINGSQSIAYIVLTPDDRKAKGIEGIRKHVVNDWITNTLGPAINALNIDNMYLICDRSRAHHKENMMNALKKVKCKSVLDIYFMPTASAKYVSPLDNPLWHSIKEVIRSHHPITTNNLPTLLSETFLSLSKNEIANAFRKCAITYGVDVVHDKPC
ncbi:unnamed protein product [Rotaria sp. Silwood2]|nr:unnamed protein product [Rotaria sp. Silwood2]CAF4669545.1 unnamed protein product [Rotaria sp. Silwood2]